MVEVLQDQVEGFQVLLDIGACEVEGTDEVLRVLVVHFVQNAAPFCGQAFDSLHALRLDHFNELFCEFLLTLVVLSPDAGELTHDNGLVFRSFIQQQCQFLLKGNLLWRWGFLEELPVDKLGELLKELCLEVVNFDGFVDLLNEAVLKVRVFVDDASIKHNTVVEGHILADLAVLADD